MRSLTARENVGLPLVLEGARPGEIQQQTQAWMERVGLWKRRNHHPYEMSGGEQQRTAIARALIHNPAIVLADEPTGNLDTANGRQVLDLLEEICRERGTTIVLVTHDSVAAARPIGSSTSGTAGSRTPGIRGGTCPARPVSRLRWSGCRRW